MALNLTEGNKYSTTTLAGYVIDRMGKADQILERLPFTEVVGNSLTYDTITTRSPGAAFYNVNDTWSESTPSLTQATAALKILGGDADVDNFLKTTRGNILDLRGEVLNDKIKSIAEKYLDTFIYGDDSTDTKQFDGLQVLIADTTYNTVHAGSSTGSDLSMVKIQEAIDLILGNSPEAILMSKKMRRYINVYLDSVGSAFTDVRDNFGRMIPYYRGLPIIISDHISDTETAASGAYSASSGSDTTTIFILTFNERACCGIQGPNGIESVPLGDLETKDAERVRIRWYCSLMLQDLRSCAKVDGIHSAGTVVA